MSSDNPVQSNGVVGKTRRLAARGIRLAQLVAARPIAHRGLHDKAKGVIENTASDRSYGARPLRRALQRFVEDPLSEALIGGGIAVRPAFLEVYMDSNKLFYRPIAADGEEKVAGLELSTV